MEKVNAGTSLEDQKKIFDMQQGQAMQKAELAKERKEQERDQALKYVNEKRLKKEIKPLQKASSVVKNIIYDLEANENCLLWRITFYGPSHNALKGGQFEVELDFNNNYGKEPPKVKFNTKIYHPAVFQDDGSIAMWPILEKWNEESGAIDVIEYLSYLLNEIEAIAYNDTQIAGVFFDDPDLFQKTCKQWTDKFAK